MVKGYRIASVEVNDLKVFEKCVVATAGPIAPYGETCLARGGNHKAPKDKLRNWNVVLELSSSERALDCYDCVETQYNKSIRDSVIMK